MNRRRRGNPKRDRVPSAMYASSDASWVGKTCQMGSDPARAFADALAAEYFSEMQ